jgi:tetratricopeptide (TPR) repeat protein
VNVVAWWQWAFPAAAAAVVVTLWLARRAVGKGPLTAVLVFAVTLAPALGFFNVYPMRYSYVADHFQYPACVAMLALAAAVLTGAAARLGPRGRWPAVAAAAVLLATLSVLTVRQQADYKDLQTLWVRTLDKNPDAWMAHTNLANLLFEKGELEQAIVHHRRAIQLNPADAKGHNNLGSALLVAGEEQEAIEQSRQALRLDPNLASAYANLAKALLATGQLDEAQAAYKQAIRLSPQLSRDQPTLEASLGRGDRRAMAAWLMGYAQTRQSQGRLEQAARAYRDAAKTFAQAAQSATGPQATAARAGLAEATRRLAAVLWQMGKSAEAPAAKRPLAEP